ncbi:spore coat protein [Bacillus wiedmannii]|nr:spore coat protein [Bacillus wiedmannii]
MAQKQLKSTVRQVLVDINLAFGTAKNVQIGSLSGGTGEVSPNTTVNTRNTGDRQLERLAVGANASKGSPVFVYKINGRVFATDELLCAPKNGTSQPDPQVVVAHSCNSCIKRTTFDTQLKSQS